MTKFSSVLAVALFMFGSHAFACENGHHASKSDSKTTAALLVAANDRSPAAAKTEAKTEAKKADAMATESHEGHEGHDHAACGEGKSCEHDGKSCDHGDGKSCMKDGKSCEHDGKACAENCEHCSKEHADGKSCPHCSGKDGAKEAGKDAKATKKK